MRGKVGLVIGLAAGYVLGTRAGRERYEQIREQAGRVWQLPAVQRRVDRAKDAGASALRAVPQLLWDAVVSVATTSGPDHGGVNGADGHRADARDAAPDGHTRGADVRGADARGTAAAQGGD